MGDRVDSDTDLKRRELARLLEERASQLRTTMPASANQFRNWSYRQKAGIDSTTIWWSAALHSPTAANDLAAAFQTVVMRHAALRTTIHWSVEGLQQTVQGSARLRVAEVNLAPGASIDDAVEQVYSAPFDMSKAPLLRVVLIRPDAGMPVLVVAVDHLVCDLWSFMIILAEVGEFLAGIRAGTRRSLPAPLQYGAFVQWQQRFLAEEVDEAWLFWDRLLGQGMPVTEFASNKAGPRTRAAKPRTVRFEIPAAVRDGLWALSRAEGVSRFVSMLAVFNLVLARFVGEREVVVGTLVTGRSRTEFQACVGDFVNAIPLVHRIEKGMSFRRLIHQLKTICVEAFQHQDVPFSALAERYAHGGKRRRSPLFQMLFIYQKPALAAELFCIPERSSSSSIAWGGEQIQPLALSQYGQEDDAYELTFQILELGDSLFGEIRFNPDAVASETMDEFLAAVQEVAALVIADIDLPVDDLGLLAPARAQHWLDNASGGVADVRPEPVHRWFEKQVDHRPQATALRIGDQSVSYDEMNARANRIAAMLSARGVSKGSVVAILMERSADMVETVYGIWKAGCAYLPLDPEAPAAFIKGILADAAPWLVLTQREHLRKAGKPDCACEVVCLDGEDVSSNLDVTNPDVSLEMSDLAYVIYTSGSTGQPKGVLCTHAGLANRIAWMQAEYGLTKDDVVLHKTPLTFDVSVWELVWPLVTGARLVIAAPGEHREPTRLAELIVRERVTVLHFVPSMLDVFIEAVDMQYCKSLSHVFCSGESLKKSVQDKFLATSSAQLHNLYGPTEASIDVTYHRCATQGADALEVPIGRPITNMSVFVVDFAGHLCPPGAVGEICLSGIGLARGYLNRPELTDDRFVPCPWKGGQRMYRTGDRGRWRPDGVVEFLGRNDFQVKVRGVRIELGEVEAILAAHPSVISAAATLVQHGDREYELHAYYSARVAVPVSELRAFADARLPQAMIPSGFHWLEKLPSTSSGKVDRKALPRPVVDRSVRQSEPPRPGLEADLAALWRAVLPVSDVGRTDDFFELGGHSLHAMRLAGLVQRDLGVEVTLSSLFARPTLAAQAEWIARASVVVREAPPITAEDRIVVIL